MSMIDSTAQELETLLASSVSLRQLAVQLYGENGAGKVGLLADVMHGRAEHVGFAALHDLRRRLGLPYDVRHVIDVPADHDAQVHVLPHGTGSLHVHHVPADAEVVIVPAGARIVYPELGEGQPKPPSTKPARKRTRVDISALPVTAQEARLILTWWVFRDERDDWPEWVKRT